MFDSIVSKYHALQDKRANGEGGFTLIELLVVVVIIGILIAIAIPLYLNYQHGAKDKSAMSDLRGAIATVNQCYTDNNNQYPAAPSANGTASTNLSFTCGSQTEVATVSSGTSLTYYPLGTSPGYTGFRLVATNSGGSGQYYSYNSNNGGPIASSSTAPTS